MAKEESGAKPAAAAAAAPKRRKTKKMVSEGVAHILGACIVCDGEKPRRREPGGIGDSGKPRPPCPVPESEGENPPGECQDGLHPEDGGRHARPRLRRGEAAQEYGYTVGRDTERRRDHSAGRSRRPGHGMTHIPHERHQSRPPPTPIFMLSMLFSIAALAPAVTRMMPPIRSRVLGALPRRTARLAISATATRVERPRAAPTGVSPRSEEWARVVWAGVTRGE